MFLYIYKVSLKQGYKKFFYSNYGIKWYVKTNQLPQGEKEFLKLFKQVKRCSNVVEFQNFQYKLLLGKVFTNNMLYKWKKVSSDYCEICDNTDFTTCGFNLWEH